MISRWEKGVFLPSTQNLLKLAVLYRTIADALLIDLIRELKEKTYKKEKAIMRNKNRKQNGKRRN